MDLRALDGLPVVVDGPRDLAGRDAVGVHGLHRLLGCASGEHEPETCAEDRVLHFSVRLSLQDAERLHKAMMSERSLRVPTSDSAPRSAAAVSAAAATVAVAATPLPASIP